METFTWSFDQPNQKKMSEVGYFGDSNNLSNTDMNRFIGNPIEPQIDIGFLFRAEEVLAASQTILVKTEAPARVKKEPVPEAHRCSVCSRRYDNNQHFSSRVHLVALAERPGIVRFCSRKCQMYQPHDRVFMEPDPKTPVNWKNVNITSLGSVCLICGGLVK